MGGLSTVGLAAHAAGSGAAPCLRARTGSPRYAARPRHPLARPRRSGGSRGAWGGRRGREAIPGAGAVPGACAPGRPGKAPLTKGGSVQTPRPGPGRRPPRAGGGRRRRGRRRRELPPIPGGRRHRAWRAPKGGWHRRAREGVGGPGHGLCAQGAPVGALVRVGTCEWGRLTRETGRCTSPTQGFLCLLHTRLCLQLSNLGTEEARTPACWGGREGCLGPGSAPLSTPRVSGERVGRREGVMRVLKAQRCVKRFRALCGFTSPRGKAMRLSLLCMGKLSHLPHDATS